VTDVTEGAALLRVLRDAAAAVRLALDGLEDWGPSGIRPGQYWSDVVADAAAIEVLDAAGLGVVSEESGEHEPGASIVVVLDPVDGSTNASRHLPWWATSLCAVDAEGMLASFVVNQATGTTWEAVRGGGARRDGEPIAPSDCTRLSEAMIGISWMPATRPHWGQFRALGAAALDLCAVAGGQLDGFVDFGDNSHGPWDYLGGLLVCREAGAVVADAAGRELVVLGHGERRAPVAAATPELMAELMSAVERQVSGSSGPAAPIWEK
jgi:fructose-1,6-bisphosphatase/inositol monophosphatase family enzyme